MKKVNNPKTKQCSLCKEIKIISDFTPNKHSKDGLTSKCKKCIAKKQREGRATDPENKYRKQNRKWNKKHKKQLAKYNKIHRLENLEHYITIQCRKNVTKH